MFKFASHRDKKFGSGSLLLSFQRKIAQAVSTKADGLEMLAGLLGWLWIFSYMSIIWLSALSIFFGWSWWNVLYATIIAAGAKWLAKTLFSVEDIGPYKAE